MSRTQIATAKVLEIVDQRIATCSETAERYVEKEDAATEADARIHYRQAAATERHALSELRHLRTLIQLAAA